MKIIIAPDKFKGSLNSFEVCNAIHEGIRNSVFNARIVLLPMADGGDGFASVMKHYLKTETIICDVTDPLGRPIRAGYEWDEVNQSAVIEMAVASGMELLKNEERNPMNTSTIGTGQMIKDAINKGARRIVLGLGGSATNDAGTGILAALGFQFLNINNKPLRTGGAVLGEIKKIKPPHQLPDVRFEIACDVQNILYGKQGAAYVYASQKGADPGQVSILDKGLRDFAEIMEQHTGKRVSHIPGSGAAGGIAAGLLSFFEVEMRRGIEIVAEASGIEKEAKDANILITGEGRIDAQTEAGKVVGFLSSLATALGIPCYAICGECDLKETDLRHIGLDKILTLVDTSTTKGEAIRNARELIIKKIGSLVESMSNTHD